MNRVIYDILVGIFVLSMCLRGYSSAKGTPYRENILLFGISFVVLLVTHYIMITFRIAILSLVCLLAMIVMIYNLVKWIIRERKFKKGIRDNQPPPPFES